MRNVGPGFSLHAKVAATSEGPSCCLAFCPRGNAMQRHCHCGERRVHAGKRLTSQL